MSALATTPESVQQLLAGLTGRQVTVKRAAAPLGLATPLALATYGDADAPPSVVWAMDFALAAHVAAALSMMPPAVPAESIRAGKLLESLPDNLHEVFNVGARMLSEAVSRRVALQGMTLPPAKAPAAVASVAASLVVRLDLDVQIAGYGAGKTAVFAPKK